MSDTQARVSSFIAQEILHQQSGNGPDPDLNLLQEGVLDSLGLQMLVGFIETSFGVSIGDDHLLPENFESINRISALVDELSG